MLVGRIVGLLSIIASLVACSGVTMPSSPAASIPNVTANAPKWQVGDEWRYTRGVFIRVIMVDGEFVVTRSNLDRECVGCSWYHDQNWTIVTVLAANNTPHDYAMASIGLKLLDFPLYVGKTWQQDVGLRQMGTGVIRPYSNQFRVEAYEPVTVKAGTFMAFRIAWEQERAAAYNPWGVPFHGKSALWWAPEARAFIKREAYSRGWGADWELVSYTLER